MEHNKTNILVWILGFYYFKNKIVRYICVALGAIFALVYLLKIGNVIQAFLMYFVPFCIMYVFYYTGALLRDITRFFIKCVKNKEFNIDKFDIVIFGKKPVPQKDGLNGSLNWLCYLGLLAVIIWVAYFIKHFFDGNAFALLIYTFAAIGFLFQYLFYRARRLKADVWAYDFVLASLLLITGSLQLGLYPIDEFVGGVLLKTVIFFFLFNVIWIWVLRVNLKFRTVIVAKLMAKPYPLALFIYFLSWVLALNLQLAD